ncbi:MAG: hypothetical protein A7316_04220 [Candidatus Altiarchaeales archaeon WOR_SM1_86-2]|nr:MAG: hypothetical protein A7316_04220 [Candidatus Altiarchaeales archaeon WOR_SM1_86-2]ODS38710.1 MAG: hypothetical protein A7315_11915 [Candidatus Altiarchaeales archaeon WOR_SM1_79]
MEKNEEMDELLVKLMERFKELGKVKVREIMSKNVITVSENDKFFDLTSRIKECTHGGFPVLNGDNKLSGIVTWTDLLKLMIFHGPSGEKLVETGSFTGIPSIKALMSTHPITLSPEDTIDDAASLMFEYGIQSIPVVEEKRVVGIVSKRDVLNRICDMIDSLP